MFILLKSICSSYLIKKMKEKGVKAKAESDEMTKTERGEKEKEEEEAVELSGFMGRVSWLNSNQVLM